MKKMILTTIAIHLLAGAAMAADLSKCSNQYLVVAPQQAQDKARVQSAISQAAMSNMLTVTNYIASTATYGIAANSASSSRVLRLMQAIKTLPGAIVECNQTLNDGGNSNLNLL